MIVWIQPEEAPGLLGPAGGTTQLVCNNCLCKQSRRSWGRCRWSGSVGASSVTPPCESIPGVSLRSCETQNSINTLGDLEGFLFSLSTPTPPTILLMSFPPPWLSLCCSILGVLSSDGESQRRFAATWWWSCAAAAKPNTVNVSQWLRCKLLSWP